MTSDTASSSPAEWQLASRLIFFFPAQNPIVDEECPVLEVCTMHHHALHMSCQLSTTQVQDKIIRANNECRRLASRAQDAGGI